MHDPVLVARVDSLKKVWYKNRSISESSTYYDVTAIIGTGHTSHISNSVTLYTSTAHIKDEAGNAFSEI